MKIKEFIQNKSWQKWDKSQWTILILAGVLLMILAIPVDGEAPGIFDDTNEADTKGFLSEETKQMDSLSREENSYVENLEKKLETTLAKIDGAGQVEVMITLEDLGESIVEKDASIETAETNETDSAGGVGREVQRKSSETTVYEDAKEGQTPFIGKEITPKIAGILVVAQGGENTSVKQNISDAVVALFQIDVNRIKVVKMNMQEEKQ